MARLSSNRERPFDLGVLPTELLPREAAEPTADTRQPSDATQAGADAIMDAGHPPQRHAFAVDSARTIRDHPNEPASTKVA